MDTPKKIYYSLLSGTVYTVNEEETKNLDKFQLPLLKKPKDSCKKCYGRGYFGYEPKLKYYPPCSCLKKLIDFDTLNKTTEKKEE